MGHVTNGQYGGNPVPVPWPRPRLPLYKLCAIQREGAYYEGGNCAVAGIGVQYQRSHIRMYEARPISVVI